MQRQGLGRGEGIGNDRPRGIRQSRRPLVMQSTKLDVLEEHLAVKCDAGGRR